MASIPPAGGIEAIAAHLVTVRTLWFTPRDSTAAVAATIRYGLPSNPRCGAPGRPSGRVTRTTGAVLDPRTDATTTSDFRRSRTRRRDIIGRAYRTVDELWTRRVRFLGRVSARACGVVRLGSAGAIRHR